MEEQGAGKTAGDIDTVEQYTDETDGQGTGCLRKISIQWESYYEGG